MLDIKPACYTIILNSKVHSLGISIGGNNFLFNNTIYFIQI